MAEGSKAESAAPTIWEALEAWGGTLRPWARYVLASAVNGGRLSDEKISDAYKLFLIDRGLAVAEEGSTPDIPTLATRPTSVLAESLVLTKVDGIRGVNALPADTALTFGPTLTVIYGRNGAGKSGFGRLFGNACFSRQPTMILPDIYAEGQQPSLAATFHMMVGTGEPTSIRIDADDDLTPLKRLSVFDAGVARHHITQSSAFEFKPAGFDVFPEMTRVYGLLSARLEAEIASRTRENTFPKAFIGGGNPTPVHEAVAALGPSTDLAALRALGSYGPTESARITELDAQLIALQSKSPKEILAQLRQAAGDIDTLIGQLRVLGQMFGPAAVSERRDLIADAKGKASAASALGSDQFRRPFFRAVGTPQWEEFAAAAHALATEEGAEYPRDHDHCLLCERPLDAASREHVEGLLRFVESDARRVAADAMSQLRARSTGLRELDVSVFAATTRVHGHVERLSPETAQLVAAAFDGLGRSRAAAMQDLTEFTSTESALDTQPALEALAQLKERVAADVLRLEGDDTEASIASLMQERRVLRHRHVLSQQLPEIEAYVEGAKWAQNAGQSRSSLNTRPITEKEKELFGQIIGDGYKTRLSRECEGLDCKVPIELQTVGRSGQTVRSLTMPGGHKPEAILSEGEQRAVALADFLTEVSQNPAAAGIILDDPVNSLDHQRRELIAKRLVGEANARQVIVFTHDLVFLNQLSQAADEAEVDLVGHWVDRDSEGRPGKVALDDSPATAKLHESTQRAEEALARAKQLSGSAQETEIRTGMGALRRTLEETVVRKLLKGVIPRWSDRVIVTALPKINWDYDKVAEVCDLYEDLSRYLEGHSHTDEASGAPPQPSDLESRISKVKELIKWAKPERPRQVSASAG